MSQLRRRNTLKYGDLESYNITDTIYIIKRYKNRIQCNLRTKILITNFRKCPF